MIKGKIMEFDTWRCPNPNCKYIITDTEMQAFRYDVGCPKCKTPLKKFIFCPAVSLNQTPDAGRTLKG